MGTIYAIKNNTNDKIYIGQTTQKLKTRLAQHLKDSRLKDDYKFQKAIKELGKENFYIVELETGIPKEKLKEKEKFYIEKLDTYYNGYNSTKGGDYRNICSTEDIAIIKKMIAKKCTNKEIASKFKVCLATVSRIRKDLNMKTLYITIPKEKLVENFHLTNTELASMFGVSSVTITRHFKRYGIKRGKGCNNHLLPQNQKKKNGIEHLGTVEI